MKTQISLLENMDFIAEYARFNQSQDGIALKATFQCFHLVIIFIFDGEKFMDSTTSRWLKENFMLGDHTDQNRGAICSLTKWKYRSQALAPDNIFMPYSIVTIVKKDNYRKVNSHHWFFAGICQRLHYLGNSKADESSVDPQTSLLFGDDEHLLGMDPVIFMTDCGTRYDQTCLCSLAIELLSRRDLVGVTGRQRVDEPNTTFHSCEHNIIFCCKCGKAHSGVVLSDNCAYCWFSYLLSPAPLQGFEFEATMVLNSAPFNIIEAMPVLPGPCQMFKWEKMRQAKIVEKYFLLLVTPETVHESYINKYDTPSGYIANEEGSILSEDRINTVKSGLLTVRKEMGTFDTLLKSNLRLAEDRVLSFLVVFGTGMGTKWVPGATFMYEPEIQFNKLLEQR